MYFLQSVMYYFSFDSQMYMIVCLKKKKRGPGVPCIPWVECNWLNVSNIHLIKFWYSISRWKIKRLTLFKPNLNPRLKYSPLVHFWPILGDTEVGSDQAFNICHIFCTILPTAHSESRLPQMSAMTGPKEPSHVSSRKRMTENATVAHVMANAMSSLRY